MKFLVNNFHIVIFFVISNILLASECIDIWYESNLSKIQNDYLLINAMIAPSFKKKNIDSLKIYIDKVSSKIKIESSKQIFIFDREKSMKLFKEKKNLYIDEPDNSIFTLLSSIFNLENIIPIRKSDFEYKLKLDSNFNKTRLLFSEDCLSLQTIRLLVDRINFTISDINFALYGSTDTLDIFDMQGDYLIYDLRE